MKYKAYKPTKEIANMFAHTIDFRNNGYQTLIYLKSGRKISIIQSDTSYGKERGLYEMSILTASGNMFNKTKINGWDDIVKGYMSKEQINEEILRLSKIY